MISNQIEKDYGETPVVCKDLSFDEWLKSLGIDAEILSKLSWGASGLLLFLQSQPEGTIVTREKILQSCSNSEEEVDSFLQELREAGL
jgi:hypothetical protein